MMGTDVLDWERRRKKKVKKDGHADIMLEV
jgi:hypothetical protein